ncbi:MAG: tetratricopeptide repeat protein [Bacteroidota bacterium]
MPPKLLAAALVLTLGLTQADLSLAAGETPAKPAPRRVAAQVPGRAQVEDTLARNVFQTLLGEFALQRGDIKLGLEAWSDLAVRTREPLVIARAAEVASFARQYDMALDLSKLWLEIDPGSVKARQMQSSLLVLANRLDDLVPQLASVLEQDPASAGSNLLQLNRMLARHADKKAVQKLVDRVAAPYASLPEAHFAMSQAAANADDNLRALTEAEKSLQLRPDWEAAALLRAQIQARQVVGTAIDSLSDFVGRYPGASDVRLALARLLISEKRYDEARQHFARLSKDNPNSPEVIYPVAMLALQQGDVATGRQQLEKLLTTDFPDKSAIHFFLGQLDEEQAKPEAALEHYRQVTAGEQYIAARSRAAQILQQQGLIEEARAFLHDSTVSLSEKPRLLLAEAQLLREAGHDDEALSLLESALRRQPDNVDMLYEAALLADRQGKPEILEKHLKHLLELQPEHAQALNALGYSWTERNVNLGEAAGLIRKAVQLAPDDPFIMDSLGWLFFRQGKLPEALKTLQEAYGIKADPEIAAHLGEVLWQLGRHDEAARLLRDAASKNPGNDVLGGIIKKLLP